MATSVDASADASGVIDAPLGVTASAVPIAIEVATSAGTATVGSTDGQRASATFMRPLGITVDLPGNLYVADFAAQRLRKVSDAGAVTTLAGSGTATFADGTGSAASFNGPTHVAVNGTGDVYIADVGNHRIRKVTSSGVVTTLAGSGVATFADGTGTAAAFNFPSSVAIDAAGSLFVADTGNHCIRKVTAAGVVTTFAGMASMPGVTDGTGTAARFQQPKAIAISSDGIIYVADAGNARIRRISPAGVVTTLAGSGSTVVVDGTGAAAGFFELHGMAVDAAGIVYVSDHNRIRKVTPLGVVTTIAGSAQASFADGPGTSARFSFPHQLAVDSKGTLYVADGDNHRIRTITTLGAGELVVSWTAPVDASIAATYTATASAAGQPARSCTATGTTSCTIEGLVSKLVYSVSVTTTVGDVTSAASASVSATPN